MQKFTLRIEKGLNKTGFRIEEEITGGHHVNLTIDDRLQLSRSQFDDFIELLLRYKNSLTNVSLSYFECSYVEGDMNTFIEAIDQISNVALIDCDFGTEFTTKLNNLKHQIEKSERFHIRVPMESEIPQPREVRERFRYSNWKVG